ncbi:hypothetical protein DVH24_030948 [Malus domestica]|uniref:Uncharacterized protein n=1 Tax=Malus domestica TaxID=3750 RepID=A0A498HGM6_MALDO|nr:hypothetical protein DVH24_030948 [Malus domestica]
MVFGYGFKGIGDLESTIDPSNFSTALIIFLGDYCDRGGLQREWRDKGGMRREGRVVQVVEVRRKGRGAGCRREKGGRGCGGLVRDINYVKKVEVEDDTSTKEVEDYVSIERVEE